MKRKSRFNVSKALKSNKLFITIMLLILLLFTYLVYSNVPVTSMNRRGIKFLNNYEYPSQYVTSDNCMEPYDVGDGVITFGPGITYQDAEQGYADINQKLGTDYSQVNSCINTDDLFALQRMILVDYEQIVNTFATRYNVEFDQHQFNALVLLAYNSPRIFEYDQFINVLINEDSTIDEYIDAAHSYYQKLRNYDKFGEGWYNRVEDSAEMYYNHDYRR